MNENETVLAVIPARGASKGLPRKNIRPLRGLPLLIHTVRQAQSAAGVDRVVVSTDDQEISRLALEAGAEVIQRPREISRDDSPSEEALLHVLGALKAAEDYRPDLVVFLQATSPLRAPRDIAAAIGTLRRESADSLFSACRLHGFVWRRQGGRLTSLTYNPDARPRRQEIGDDFVENGSIYVFKPWVLERHGNRLGGKVVLYEMDPLSLFQVDEPGDLSLLERLWESRERGGSA